MSVSTIRPDGTPASTSITVTGAANAHAALSDNSDSSYIALDAVGDSLTEDFGDFTLPAGAIVRAISLRIRHALLAAGSGGYLVEFGGFFAFGAVIGNLELFATSTAITTIETGDLPYNWGEAAVDGIQIRLTVNDSALFQSLRVYELYLDVKYVAKPVIDVTLPTGTVTNTNRPTVQWTETLDTDGGPQGTWQVRIFTAAQYGAGGFAPGTSPATQDSSVNSGTETSWQVPAILPDGTYRAYVRVAQLPDGYTHYSDWTYEQFTINVALPAVPTMVLTAEPASARVKIALTHNTGSATTDALEIERSLDAGVTWESLRTVNGDGLALSADATVYDLEAPNGDTVQYRARALHNYSGVYAASAWATGSKAWTSTVAWIKHPLRPSLNTPVSDIDSYPGRRRAARQGVFQPLGATQPIVISDTRAGATGTLKVRLDTAALQAAVLALVETEDTLLVQPAAGTTEPDRYVRIGDHESMRLADKGFIAPTVDTLPWVEVASPTGDIDAWPA